MQMRLLDPESYNLTYSLPYLAIALNAQGQRAEAEAAARRAVAIGRKIPQGGRNLGWSLDVLAKILRGAGKHDEAREIHLEALEAYQAVADYGDTWAMQELAWILATCEDESLRAGLRAVALAEKAVAESNRESAFILDTLAAAYAETGQFDLAVSVEKEAIKLLHSPIEELSARLKLYESRTPYRDAQPRSIRY